ncbi:phosphonate ABC transporter, permease protein PhnE [Paenalkalicoccus suaedae]|uniref:Phosphonate ABC transporter, permease protein PhnE n=1 Tax=Paenalkalicoccus suaedae TaxID=2592382 RepID=A0A859FII1_9BACI|nr:phosphonate ABC transporter, permease protein PhnE [Paenalkalicoccus suaedae]QKS72492.1 phosphonate ABC transporter, permease protein PhnE [Paenalkalicoccus suaedae]
MESLARELKVKTEEQSPSIDYYAELSRRKKYVMKSHLVIWSILLLLVGWSWYGTGFSLSILYYGPISMTGFIVENLLRPDFTAIPQYLSPAIMTIYMSFAGMVLSVIASLFFAFMSASNTTPHKSIAFMSRSIVAFLRAVPALILGMVLVVAFGLGTLAGTLALAISGIGILGRAFADVIEEIDEKQVDAVRATGANWFQIMGQAVWPQFKSGFVAWSLYKMDLNIREAAVLGLIGAGGIGYALQGNLNLFQYDRAVVGILMIFGLILAVEFATAKIRERII